jgi:hypothetical protein
MIAFATFLICSLPWFLKSYEYMGNPFYPYFPDWFGGRRLSDVGYTRLLLEQREFVAGDIGAWLRLPWTLFMKEQVGPFFMAALPLVLIRRFFRPDLRAVGVTVILFFAGALFVTHYVRFYLPALVLFYVLAGVSFSDFARPLRMALFLLAAGAGIYGLLPIAGVSALYHSPGGIWRGGESRTDYLRRGCLPITPSWIGSIAIFRRTPLFLWWAMRGECIIVR